MVKSSEIECLRCIKRISGVPLLMSIIGMTLLACIALLEYRLYLVDPSGCFDSFVISMFDLGFLTGMFTVFLILYMFGYYGEKKYDRSRKKKSGYGTRV